MTVPTTARARRPVPIAGVVDGHMTTAHDQDGNVCLYLTFGSGPSNDGVHLEFVLSYEDARALERSLANGSGTTEPVPCRVGIRLRH
jgi:hypothetical protein